MSIFGMCQALLQDNETLKANKTKERWSSSENEQSAGVGTFQEESGTQAAVRKVSAGAWPVCVRLLTP